MRNGVVLVCCCCSVLFGCFTDAQQTRRHAIAAARRHCGGGGVRLIATSGATVDDATRNAAVAFCRSEALELLDLIPADLPALEALAMAQLVEPATYRSNRVARGHTAGYAMVASRTLMERAGVSIGTVEDPIAFSELAATLKRFAASRADIAVASTLRGSAGSRYQEWPVFLARLGSVANGIFIIPGLLLALFAAGFFFKPLGAGIALAVLHLSVVIAIVGTNIRPRDWVR